MKVFNVVGARPNFMKVAPIQREMRRSSLQPILIHTGQHYDRSMSQVFFEDLGLPRPDVYLGVGAGSHAEQTARVMVEFERVCLTLKPDLVLVVGDVNSTLACALVGAKLSIPVAHVEAGLRSWDRTMPEEINRIVTDSLSEHLFIHSPEAERNLLREGIPRDRIHSVGNVMIDSLVFLEEKAQQRYLDRFARRYAPGRFGLVTLHRPSNVDDPEKVRRLVGVLEEIARGVPLLFPVHPRTRANLNATGLAADSGLELCEPVGYLEFLGLMRNARIVITDSGGIQEETSYLGIPCVTARDNTERPITVERGTNILAGGDPDRIRDACRLQLETPKRPRPIPLWDGKAAARIVAVLGG